jgi:hypothetical protein
MANFTAGIEDTTGERSKAERETGRSSIPT